MISAPTPLVTEAPSRQATPDRTALSRLATTILTPPRLALGAVLAVAAVLNFWALNSLGYANSYYAAAVRSMLQSWHNFFFVSFDPGGFVTIDKPPLGFWIETASAKLFGFSGVSLLLPEALAGVLSVAVLYQLVARVWGRSAGLLAGLFLALTPVSVVTSRNNTIDSLLVLAVLLAAWAVARAAELARLRWLLLGAVLVGLGFNIKMLEAYLVVPALGLVYLLGARTRWYRRLGHLALAAVVLLVVSLSWAVAVDLTPASARPYVGSSGTNSELNLALGYNGLSRLLGGSGTPGGGGGGNALFNGGPAGVFRLLGTTLGGQVSWLLVLAVLGLVVAATRIPWRRLDERGRSLLLWGAWLLTAGAFFSVAEFFHPYYTVMLAPAIAALAAIGVAALWREYRSASWRGWLLPLVLLASAAVEAYILRDYPDWSRWLTPLVVGAALAAALALAALRLRPRRIMGVGLLAVGLAVTALLAAPTTWAAYSVANGTNATIPIAGPSARASDGFGGGPGGSGGNQNGPRGVGAGQGGFGAPGNASGGTGAGPGAPPMGGFGSGAGTGATGSSGSGATTPFGAAGSSRFAGRGGGNPGDQVNTALLRYLETHQGSAKYLVATASSMSASSFIITTGKPVMALGGFSGGDKILTTQQLARLVANGTVHYFLIQSGGPGGGGAPPASMLSEVPSSMRAQIAKRGGAGAFGGNGGPGGNSALTQWVTAHGTVVPASQYETSSTSATSGFGQTALYYVSSAAATT